MVSLMYIMSTDIQDTVTVILFIFIMMFPAGCLGFFTQTELKLKLHVQTKCVQGEPLHAHFLQAFDISLWSIMNNKGFLFSPQMGFSSFSSIIIL